MLIVNDAVAILTASVVSYAQKVAAQKAAHLGSVH